MPLVTHFKSPEGEQLPIAASELAVVEIPAAGSTDLGDWLQAAESSTEHYNQQAALNAPTSSAVIPHCTDPSVFTDHGLRIEYEEQLQGWVLWVDSLPETACTLTLLFIHHDTEDTPCVLPALGVGGSTSELPEILVLDDINDLPADTKDGTFLVVPRAESEDSGESGGSESGTSSTKVIDLNDEKYGGFGSAICQFVLTAEDGTYQHTADEAIATAFVEECNTEEPLIVKMGLDNGVVPPLSIEIPSINKCYQSGELGQVTFGVTIYYGGVITVNLAITAGGTWFISKTTQSATG